MNRTRNSEESIFADALARNPGKARDDFLSSVCKGDVRLRARINRLIEVHEAGEHSLLDRPFNMGETADQKTFTESICEGAQIDRYKLLQEIGEGGFGVVYMVEQVEPVRRRVALKVIKKGMDTREVVARFEAERQALAMMDHPNIAKVLDAGATKTGQPYFVMELVKGVPVTQYADDNQLPARERLQLFIQICQAMQHAHHKGVIHRDLKPSNLMVTLHDGVPVAKVIDFGVSKALNQKLTEKTLFTRYGQIIGTPQYMSPEQAEFSGLDVDTRSDVYSLGVLLYELLTGRPPFDIESLREAGFDEMRRIIREDDPQKPSDRLSTLDKETATTVAKNRSSQPKTLSKFVRGELDWIVMKSLEKNRERRFDSAGNFALEIKRYLNGEAIQTAAPSFSYLLQKRFQRHRTAYLTGAAVFVVLAAAAVFSYLNYLKAADALQDLEKQYLTAEGATDLLVSAISGNDPTLLRQIAAESSRLLAGDPQREYDVLNRIGERMINSLEKPVEIYERVKELAQKLYGTGSPEHAGAIRDIGVCKQEIELVEQAIEIDVRNHRAVPFITNSIYGRMLYYKRDFVRATEILESAVEAYEFDLVNRPFHEIPHLWLAESKLALNDDASYSNTLEIGLQELKNFFPDWDDESWKSFVHSKFGYDEEKRPVEIFDWALRCLSQPHSSGHLANVLRQKGRMLEAHDVLQKRIDFLKNQYQTPNVRKDLAWAHFRLGRVHVAFMDYEKAKEILISAKDIIESNGEYPFMIWFYKFELGLIHYQLGNRAESKSMFKEVNDCLLDHFKEKDEPIWPAAGDGWVFVTTSFLGEIETDPKLLREKVEAIPKEWGARAIGLNHLKQGEIDEAVRMLENSYLFHEYWFPMEDYLFAEVILFELYEQTARMDQAVDFIEKALLQRDNALAYYHPERWLGRYRAAKFLIKNGIELDLAGEYLKLAKENLQARALMPQEYLDEIDQMLDQLKLNKQEAGNGD